MGNKKLTIDPEFKALIPPLPDEEHAALEQSILRDGCRDALVVWNGILVDGHNRYEICNRIGKAFRTVPLERVDSRERAMAWMIDNQLARRNVSDLQRIELALKKKNALAALAQEKQKAGIKQDSNLLTNLSKGPAMNTRREVAKDARVSEGTVAKVEKMMISAVPEVLEMARADEIKIDVAFQVATLPKDEQVALAANGKDAMKSAAKDLRKSKQNKKVAEVATLESEERTANPKPKADPPSKDERVRLRAEVAMLRNRVKELTKASKNTQLKSDLAYARTVNLRLTELCEEKDSRIAALEKENEVLRQREDMPDQEVFLSNQAEASIEDRADNTPAKKEANAVFPHAGCALPFPLLDASAA